MMRNTSVNGWDGKFWVFLPVLGSILLTARAPAQVDHLVDVNTGEVSVHTVVQYERSVGRPVTIYSLQSPQGGVANVESEASIYLAPDNEPLPISVFLDFRATTGSTFPGAMIADNMGLGSGFTPGWDDLSSYETLFFRSATDPQPGLADFHIALWDGDPLCSLDTPGGGFSCTPIAGTEADFADIPANTVFTARHVIPKGVTAPNHRVWMVVSGSETGVNPSPCRLGWDIAYGPAIIGDNSITGSPNDDDIFLTQEDEILTGTGVCCGDGSACDANATCPGDGTTLNLCSDGDAETPHVYTIANGPGTRCEMYAGAQCANFTARIRAPAVSTIRLLPVGTSAGTITGHEVSLPGGQHSLELEIRIGNWDPDGIGTRLKAWEADIESAGYYTGFRGFLTPTTVDCATYSDCLEAFGGVCSIYGTACTQGTDCPLFPIERCGGSGCRFPISGPNAYTQCEPGFTFCGRPRVFIQCEPPNVDLSTINYRYAAATATGNGVPVTDFTPFPPDGVYSGTLRLDTSEDCKGTFTVGFKPPPSSVLVNQNNEFIPLVGFVPAKITCEIRRCCFDIIGAGGCLDNVTEAQCNAQPGLVLWDPDPNATCTDPCAECIDDAMCQDDLWCNGDEICDAQNFCAPGNPRTCDDGVSCTDDFCDENNDVCVNMINDALCDDGVWCNGFETCDATSNCQPGTPPCDDAIVCTSDFCDEALEQCTFTPDDQVCDDGAFCNGSERCDPVTGCTRHPSPCSVDLCDENADTCATPPIPTVSTWGLLALSLMLLVGSKIRFGDSLISESQTQKDTS